MIEGQQFLKQLAVWANISMLRRAQSDVIWSVI